MVNLLSYINALSFFNKQGNLSFTPQMEGRRGLPIVFFFSIILFKFPALMEDAHSLKQMNHREGNRKTTTTTTI